MWLKFKGSEKGQWGVTRLQVHVCKANQADFPGLCERMGCHLPPTTLSGSANVSVKGWTITILGFVVTYCLSLFL